MMCGVYLLLGTNLGDKNGNLEKARKQLSRLGSILAESSIYETSAWGKTDQPNFLNQVVKFDTPLSPQELLKEILTIEEDLGRIRKEKWGERIIDLDILYFNDQVIDSPSLKIPHPGIPTRKFTLVPLVELDANFKHPINAMTNESMLKELQDDSLVLKT